MPIEFNCNQCGKRLRTGDGTVGKQVRCPACGTVQTVPDAGFQQGAPQQAPSPSAPQSAFESPLGPPPFPAVGDMGDNPYASPALSSFGPAPGAAGPRTGPAWEREGNSLVSFFMTLRDVAFFPRWFFSSMQRDAGLAGPLRFAVLGGIIGCSFMAIYGLIYQAIGGANAAGPPGAFAPQAGRDPVSLLGGLCCCSGILAPLATLAYVFAATGVFHATLAMFGGARFGMETTLRVVAYSLGTMVLFGIVPACGPYLAMLMHLVYLGIGLSFAHETDGWKAALAVLLPALLCGGGFAAAIVLLIASLGVG